MLRADSVARGGPVVQELRQAAPPGMGTGSPRLSLRRAWDEQRQVSLGVRRNKPRKSLIRNKAGSQIEKETKRRKGKKKKALNHLQTAS